MENTQLNEEIKKAQEAAKHFGVDFVSLRGREILQEILNIIPEDIARRNDMVVYDKDGKHIFIAVANPDRLKQKAPEILSKLKKEQDYNFSIAITTLSDLNYALLGYKQKADIIKDESRDKIDESPVEKVDLVSMGNISKEILNRLPEKIASKYRIVVFSQDENAGSIDVAIENLDNLQTKEILDFISSRNNLKINKYVTSEKDIDWALGLYKQPDIKPTEEAFNSDQTEPKEEFAETKEENKNNLKNEKKEEISSSEDEIEEKKEEIEEKVPTYDVIDKIKDEKPVKNDVSDKQAEPKEEKIKVDLDLYTKKEDESENSARVSDEEQNDLDRLLIDKVETKDKLTQIINQGSIPKIVAAIIKFAVSKNASDIHIEAEEKKTKLRYRLDGVLVNILDIPYVLNAPIISRIKILSKLKIDEKRIPQDGRFGIVANKKNIDLRVSTLPTVHGEKCVMRILDKSTGIIALEKLGLTGSNLEKAKRAISKPYGIVFVTGPTGSGKTTTLYAMLDTLNSSEVNIITLEDPVEYELPGVNQCQIKPDIGFGFAEGLRSILRQDPNIIMVGEVRDTETANMATHAALTGHLVLSTLHTNDSTGALPRLIDMGVEPFLITSSINAIIAQRLVRKLCDDCKEIVQIPEKLLASIKQTLSLSQNLEIKELLNKDMIFYKPKGCQKCKDGYIGRIGLYETLEMTERIEQLVINRSPASTIKRAAENQGLITLLQDGYVKALLGITSIDEVIRVTKR